MKNNSDLQYCKTQDKRKLKTFEKSVLIDFLKNLHNFTGFCNMCSFLKNTSRRLSWIFVN